MAHDSYWEKEIELLPRTELNKLQLERLNTTIERAAHTPFYKTRLGKRNITSLKSLRQVHELPFTTKQDLRDHFPFGFLCVNPKQILRLHSSSGTTGNPTVVFHTRQDIDTWSNIMARCLYMSGARATDVFQNMMGYGLFTGGLGLHYGAEKLGMLTIPIGPGNSKRQIWFMRQFKTTAIHVLPSYALRLAGLLSEMGISPQKDLTLRMAFIGAEPHSREIRLKIEELLQLKAYNSYGLSEMCGPGVAFECQAQSGMHIWEDQFFVEIIDPDSGEVMPDGEQGELVLTTLTREAMPLLRYRTRDLTCIETTPCSCGRTHRRLARIKGRTDDMLIINGVNIFPIQIEQVLMRIPEVGTNYEIHIDKENYMDKLHIWVEIERQVSTGAPHQAEFLQKKIQAELAGEITVNPEVTLVGAYNLQAADGKAVRVFDHRNEENK
ncbi:MAG: phenylacetate--CoA ligase [Spirochaetales bacterium]|nr:phenylacetate--CoA ligase [Spirochaetales bacterium]